VAEGVWRIADEDPARAAVVEATGAIRTYRDLADEANRLTHGLRRLGLAAGDVVAAVLPNEATLLALQLAAFQGGLYLVPVNTRLTPPEIAYILDDSRARAVVHSDRFAAATGAALDSLAAPPPAFSTAGSLGELTAGVPATRPTDRSAGAAMHYTSGTTGRPKGVRRPLAGLDPDLVAERLPGFLAIFGVTPHGGAVHLAVSPLYHTAVMTFSTTSLHAGHTVVLMDGWSPEETLRMIAEQRVSTTHMVPTQFHRLLALPDDVRAAADVSSLSHVIHAAAPCPIEDKRRMLDWWGPVIYEYYAGTEGNGFVYCDSAAWLQHPGTVGRPIMGEVHIVDDAGEEVPTGQTGTVYFGGGLDFAYHNDPEKTASAHDARGRGWSTLGDVGYVDDEGFLYLTDRKAYMIITGGVNVYPQEAENVLAVHPKVADVAVLGVPDDEFGEAVKAVVEPIDMADAGPELERELIAYCRERLADVKCPRSVDFRAELPRHPTGKLYKRLLKDEYWTGHESRIL
jgi:acyl-CoA synthetase (AMP-forming)/AMP-acid ligase II